MWCLKKEVFGIIIFDYTTDVRLSGMNLVRVCVCTPSSYRGVNLTHGSMHNYACANLNIRTGMAYVTGCQKCWSKIGALPMYCTCKLPTEAECWDASEYFCGLLLWLWVSYLHGFLRYIQNALHNVHVYWGLCGKPSYIYMQHMHIWLLHNCEGVYYTLMIRPCDATGSGAAWK